MANDLAERIEKLEGPDREIFEEAFLFCFPEPEPGCEPAWRPETPRQPIYHAWKTKEIAFRDFVRAKAWLSAAELLVPEGLTWELIWNRYTKLAECTIWLGGEDDSLAHAYAKTPALALAAAAIRAREAG